MNTLLILVRRAIDIGLTFELGRRRWKISNATNGENIQMIMMASNPGRIGDVPQETA